MAQMVFVCKQGDVNHIKELNKLLVQNRVVNVIALPADTNDGRLGEIHYILEEFKRNDNDFSH